MLVNGGASLPLIGSLLGHTQVATTARYSHLYDDAQRAAVERAGAALTGKQKRLTCSIICAASVNMLAKRIDKLSGRSALACEVEILLLIGVALIP